MRRESQLQKDIDSLTSQLKILQEERDAARKRKTIKCPECSKRTQLPKIIVLKEHHYITPSGC